MRLFKNRNDAFPALPLQDPQHSDVYVSAFLFAFITWSFLSFFLFVLRGHLNSSFFMLSFQATQRNLVPMLLFVSSSFPPISYSPQPPHAPTFHLYFL